jgi:hypothetical protein
MSMVDYPLVWVVPVHPGKVAAIEEHPEHPDGQIIVTWDAMRPDEQPNPTQVAQTPYVLGRMQLGMLEVVVPPGKPSNNELSEKDIAIRALSKIKGVGESRAEELYELGFQTLRDLASLDEEEMIRMSEEANSFSLSQIQGWRNSARRLI